MTFDDSTLTNIRDAEPLVREFTTEHDKILRSVVTQLAQVTARLETLEARDTSSTTGPTTAAGTTPAWRTKNGRQTGWQPARR